MSSTTDDYAHRLNLAEQVARIEQMNEETHKFVVEARKMEAERDKLAAEALKLGRDRAVVPWQVMATLLGTGGALVAATVAPMKALG